jgi:hypothetical protein
MVPISFGAHGATELEAGASHDICVCRTILAAPWRETTLLCKFRTRDSASGAGWGLDSIRIDSSGKDKSNIKCFIGTWAVSCVLDTLMMVMP